MGHEFEKDQIIYETKIIKIKGIWSKKLSNIICIASGKENTCFLKNDGLIYFCGHLGGNEFQKIPKIIDINTRFDSLAFVQCFSNHSSDAIAINIKVVHHLKINNIAKSESKLFFDYFSKNHGMTHKTIGLSVAPSTEETDLC